MIQVSDIGPSWPSCLEFLSKKMFFIFLCWNWIIDVLQQYCENFRKIEQAELKVTYPKDFCMICIHFYYGKKWQYLIFSKPVIRIKLTAQVVTTNCFALNHKSLQICFFCVKRQAKYSFPTAVESTVVTWSLVKTGHCVAAQAGLTLHWVHIPLKVNRYAFKGGNPTVFASCLKRGIL